MCVNATPRISWSYLARQEYARIIGANLIDGSPLLDAAEVARTAESWSHDGLVTLVDVLIAKYTVQEGEGQ